MRLATWMPFEQARELLQKLLGIQVRKATARRVPLTTGEAALAVWEAEVERLQQEVPQAPDGADQQLLSADGAEWLQGLVNYHRPDAMRILDFAHAASAEQEADCPRAGWRACCIGSNTRDQPGCLST